ncbi:MAG: CBS domain-containing protein [Saprospirales bacterium]|jgi:CBS domain containing-hemolysin-like protein|nr:CBS domain-containing protein [Saprospirales bacterium]MBK8924191.1 CBS domain-containing protein [Saprospirales bacterium]
MVWFTLGISVYFLVLLAERALLGLSPHDLEHLRATDTRSARRAYRLATQLRPAVAALLHARILLKILLAVFLTNALAKSAPVRNGLYDWSEKNAWPGVFTWILAAAAWVLLLALFFWALKKMNWPVLEGEKARRALQFLGPCVLFWKFLFSTAALRARTASAQQPAVAAEPVPGSTTATTPDKQRDIELLKSIVKFSDVTVKQVMQPRSRVVAVDFRTGFGDLLHTVREAGFSRMPVYDEDLDNVTGILYVKDLVSHLDKPDGFEWQSLIRTNVQLVPEAKRASELLQEFKRNRRHMAIVVDEYGGSSGIVTMEDILEEITGEIRDEFDEESEIRYRKLDEHNYLFEGQTLLNDVCRIAGLNPGAFDEVRGAADTLAGLALELSGDIPNSGTELRWQGYLLTVVAANNRKIEQVKLTL